MPKSLVAPVCPSLRVSAKSGPLVAHMGNRIVSRHDVLWHVNMLFHNCNILETEKTQSVDIIG